MKIPLIGKLVGAKGRGGGPTALGPEAVGDGSPDEWHAPPVRGLRGRLLGRIRIATQLYISIGGAVMLTLLASLVAWFSFNSINDAQVQVNEGSVPELASAFGIAQYGQTLVAAAPSLTVAENRADFQRVVAEIDVAYEAFEGEMLALEAQPGVDPERIRIIRDYANTLYSNIDSIGRQTNDTFELNDLRGRQQINLASLGLQLDSVLVPAIDDQLFFIMTGYPAIDQQQAQRLEHFSEEQVERYRRLVEIQSDAKIGGEQLASAFTSTDPRLIDSLRDEFEAATSRIDRNLITLSGTEIHTQAQPILDGSVCAWSERGRNLWTLSLKSLQITKAQRELLESNRALSIELLAEVDGLVISSQQGTLDGHRRILSGYPDRAHLACGHYRIQHRGRLAGHLAVHRPHPAQAAEYPFQPYAKHGRGRLGIIGGHWRPG